MQLGFVGLGTMGGPMASALIEAGHDVTVFDLKEAAVTALVDQGASEATDLERVGEAAEVVFLCLPGPPQVDTVLSRDDGLQAGLDRGDVVIDTTTNAPARTRHNADLLAVDGVTLLGAPVSGGASGAAARTLTTMIGGELSVVESCRPLFEAFSGPTIHVGPRPSDGHAVKLLNNFLSLTALLATSEAVVLGRRAGLDLNAMLAAFNASSGRNSATEDKFPGMVTDPSADGSPIEYARKDARLMTAFADEHEASVMIGQTIRQLLGYAANRYGNDADFTRVYDFFEEVMLEGDPNVADE
jgi:3-hydroxyisobutyrate dehydrogenase-like beta-hydroxyacid dehydrogenase